MQLRVDICDDPRAYTNGDVIKGHVRLSYRKDTVIDGFEINFLGTSSIHLKDRRLRSTPKRHLHGTHTFLKMSQPIETNELPIDGIARRGRKYLIPFSFAVPDTLLSYACSCAAGCSEKAHLMLPPSSLGPSATKNPLCKALNSQDATVTYVVEVRFKRYFSDGTSKVFRTEKEVFVTPSGETTPPIDSTNEDPNHDRYHSLDAVLTGHSVDVGFGRIHASIIASPSLELDRESLGNARFQMFSLPVELQFQPSGLRDPPLADVEVKMKLLTTTAWGARPNKKSPKSRELPSLQAQRTEKTSLKSVSLNGLAWTRQASGRSPPTYSTAFRLPMNLPKRTKAGMYQLPEPTFTSCTISRSHRIKLDFSFEAASTAQAKAGELPGVVQSLQQRLTPRAHLKAKVPLHVYYGGLLKSLEDYGMDSVCRLQRKSIDDLHIASVEEQSPPAYTPVLR